MLQPKGKKPQHPFFHTQLINNMPPQLSHCLPIPTTKPPYHSQISPESHFKRILHQKYFPRKMKFTKRKLIPLLFFVLCSASTFRFLNMRMINTNSSSSMPSSVSPPTNELPCSSGSSICKKNTAHRNNSLTEKELKFLLEFFSRSVPCKLLVFGLERQYSTIASLNAGGLTVFLEDNLQKAVTIKPTNNSTQVYNIKYNTVALGAYQLLKGARENSHCSPNFNRLQTKCNLALTNLPQEVYNTMWDVVVVDGPSGDGPSSPGRMASIYMSGVLARRGNGTHVIVHDVDRMIEKWFSWEFLCEEHLVSSKGRFWHFQVLGATNATTFCTP